MRSLRVLQVGLLTMVRLPNRPKCARRIGNYIDLQIHFVAWLQLREVRWTIGDFEIVITKTSYREANPFHCDGAFENKVPRNLTWGTQYAVP